MRHPVYRHFHKCPYTMTHRCQRHCCRPCLQLSVKYEVVVSHQCLPFSVLDKTNSHVLSGPCRADAAAAMHVEEQAS